MDHRRSTLDVVAELLDKEKRTQPDSHGRADSHATEAVTAPSGTAAITGGSGISNRVAAAFDASGHQWTPSNAYATTLRNSNARSTVQMTRALSPTNRSPLFRLPVRHGVTGLASQDSGIYQPHVLIDDSFDPTDVDSILAERLKQHEDLMSQHRAVLDRQRQWLGHRGMTPASELTADSSRPLSPSRRAASDLMASKPAPPTVENPAFKEFKFDPSLVSPLRDKPLPSEDAPAQTTKSPAPSALRKRGASVGRGSTPSSQVTIVGEQSKQANAAPETATARPMDIIRGTVTVAPPSPPRKSVSIVDKSSLHRHDSKSVEGGVGSSDPSFLKTASSSSLTPRGSVRDASSAAAAKDSSLSAELQGVDPQLARRAASFVDGTATRKTSSIFGPRMNSMQPQSGRAKTPTIQRSAAESADPLALPASRGSALGETAPKPQLLTSTNAASPQRSVSATASIHARRQMELEHARKLKEEEELAQLVFTPRLSGQSHRLAERHRQKYGVEGMPIEESLTARHEASIREKWIMAQYIQAKEVPARPQVNPTSSKANRAEGGATDDEDDDSETPDAEDVALDVVDRLYKAAHVSKQRKREMESSNDPEATFVPSISKRARMLQRKPGHTVGEDLHALGQAKARRDAAMAQMKPKSAEPSIDPVSALIASKLSESAWERLQTRTTTSRNSKLKEPDPHFTPQIDPRSDRTARRMKAARVSARSVDGAIYRGDDARRHQGGLRSPRPDQDDRSDSENSDADVAELLYQDAKRWAARKDELKKQAAEREVAGCTFMPNLEDVHRGGGGGKSKPSSGSSSRPISPVATLNKRYEARGGPSIAERAQLWEQKRQQRLNELQQQAAKKEEEELQPHPNVHHRNGALGAFPREELNRLAQETSLYGGTGDPWGTQEHLERQRAARELKMAKEEAARQAFATGDKWRPRVTTPHAPALGPDARRQQRQEENSAARSLRAGGEGVAAEDGYAVTDFDAALRRHYAGDYDGLPDRVSAVVRGVAVNPQGSRGSPTRNRRLVADHPDMAQDRGALSDWLLENEVPVEVANAASLRGRVHLPIVSPMDDYQQRMPSTVEPAPNRPSAADVLERAREALSRAHLASTRI